MNQLKVLFLAIALLLAGCADIPDEEYVLGTPVAVATQLDLPTEDTEMAQNGWSKTVRMTSNTSKLQGESLQLSAPDNDYSFTVQFELVITQYGTAGMMPRALISWTIGGASVSRLVSIGSGTSVTGVGTNVTVLVYDASTEHPINGAGITPAEYSVVVTCGKGVRGPAQVGPILIPWVESRIIGGGVTFQPGQSDEMGGGVGDASQILIEIPPGSGVTSWYWDAVGSLTGVAIPEATFRYWVTGMGFNGVMGNAARRGTWIPLTPGATTIYVAIDSGWALEDLIVTTVLGIDG